MVEMLKDKCMEYIAEREISQVKFATLIGVSESTFSRFIKGNYPNAKNVIEKINEFFAKEEARDRSMSINDISFAETGTAKKILGILEYCRIQKSIGVIYGDAGTGKTYTLREWSRDKKDVYVVTANPAFATPKPFLKLLARSLKTTKVGSMDDILLEILDKLEGSDKMIIIDEAQHLTRKALEVVRSLNDLTNAAIVMVGNEMIYTKMLGKQQAEFAQLFSRLGMRGHILTDHFTFSDMELIFNEGKEEKEFLLKISRSKYGLRGAVHVYTNAKNNGNLSIKGLQAMATAMGITA